MLTTPHPLKLDDALAFKNACAHRGPIAFCGVLPPVKVPGIEGALGIAIANEPGYTPIPLGWARYADLGAAADHASELNQAIGVPPAMAVRIVISTMGGIPYRDAPGATENSPVRLVQ